MKRAELEKLEDFKKFVLNRFDIDSLKVKDLTKKVDPYERRFEAIANDVDGKHKDTVIRLNALEAKIEKDFQEFELRLAKSGGNQFSGDTDLMTFLKKQFQCDAHQPFSEGSQVMDRLLKLEEENVKINNNYLKLFALISALQADVANKIDLATFSTQIGKKIDREEMLDLIKTFQADEEKNRKMQQDIVKLKKKLKETIDFVEDKIKDLKKEFDITYINKVLKAKAEDKDVRNQFKSMGDTMAEQKHLFDGLKKDLENLILAYKKLSQFISLLQDEDANTLASSKQLCLSCGRGSKFAPEHKQAMGADGNMYYVDVGSSTCDHKGRVRASVTKYDNAAEVFSSAHGVHSHNLVNHHEGQGLNSYTGNTLVVAAKRPQTATAANNLANRSTASLRPQSSRANRSSTAGLHLTDEKKPVAKASINALGILPN